MNIIVTGSVGFIGAALTKSLLEKKNKVIGIDNHNNYYDQSLKEDRLKLLKDYKNYHHFRVDIKNKDEISNIFKNFQPQVVVNLAAQAGVRYSIDNPISYVESNLLGFFNILDTCKNYKVDHLVYASSSSVYGSNSKVPFSTSHNVDHPLNMYAATKKSNELMAHSYSHLHDLPTTGLRFFTVYGPWDRPDMALHKFAIAISKGQSIKIYNNGNHTRDFTYIDDIIEGIEKVINKPSLPDPNFIKNPQPYNSSSPWAIYNIGNNNPVNLLDFIKYIEMNLGKPAIKEFLPLQEGDIANTWADIDNFDKVFNFRPKTSIENGIKNFCDWFKDYYKF